MGSIPSHGFESRLWRLRQRETHCLWMDGGGVRKTVRQSSFPVTRPVRLLLQAGRWGGRDSSISGTGIPGLREREALRDCVGEAELVLCKAGGLHGLHSGPLPLSVSQQQPRALWRPWWCCDKQSIHFLLSFTGLSGKKKGRANPNHRLESTLQNSGKDYLLK